MNEFEMRLMNPQANIQPGGWYEVRDVQSVDMIRYKRMKAVKKYPHFWLFEDARGTRECFSEWYVGRYSR